MLERRSTLPYRAVMLVLAVLFTTVCYRIARNARAWEPELAAVNALFRMRGPRPARSDFRMVAINNQKRKLVDAKGDVSRTTLAALIRRAKTDGARAIVLDLYLPNRTTHAVDRDLWLAIAQAGNVFLPAMYLPDRGNVLSPDDVRNLRFLEKSVLTGTVATYGPPPPVYTWWKFQPPVSDFTQSAAGKSGGVGVAADEPDSDGTVRRVRLAYLTDIVYPPGVTASNLVQQGNVSNVVVPGIVVPLVNYVMKVDKSLVVVNYNHELRYAADLNPRIDAPLDDEGRMLINYTGPVGSFPYINAADLLGGQVDKKQFDGKIVFIGLTEGAKADFHATPYSPQAPRMDITANALATVLDRAFLTQSVEGAWVPLGFLALFLALTFPFFTLIGATVWAIVCGVGYGILAWVCFAKTPYGIIPLLPALFLIGLFWLSTLALRFLLLPRTVYRIEGIRPLPTP